MAGSCIKQHPGRHLSCVGTFLLPEDVLGSQADACTGERSYQGRKYRKDRSYHDFHASDPGHQRGQFLYQG